MHNLSFRLLMITEPTRKGHNLISISGGSSPPKKWRLASGGCERPQVVGSEQENRPEMTGTRKGWELSFFRFIPRSSGTRRLFLLLRLSIIRRRECVTGCANQARLDLASNNGPRSGYMTLSRRGAAI